MGQFVISVEANGAVSGLQSKPGQGFDLRQLGKAEIQRASEVLWDQHQQRWYVEIRRGRYTGRTITTEMMGAALAHSARIENPMSGLHCTALFDEYDAAVAAEIMVLDHIRATEGAAALR